MSDWYTEHQDILKSRQSNMSREEVAENLQKNSEHVFDPDNAPKIFHNWVDRGLKYSCEDAGHPMHQAWKRQKLRDS